MVLFAVKQALISGQCIGGGQSAVRLLTAHQQVFLAQTSIIKLDFGAGHSLHYKIEIENVNRPSDDMFF